MSVNQAPTFHPRTGAHEQAKGRTDFPQTALEGKRQIDIKIPQQDPQRSERPDTKARWGAN